MKLGDAEIRRKKLTRSNRKRIQSVLAATWQSMPDLGAQPTSSWNKLYVGDRLQHYNCPTFLTKYITLTVLHMYSGQFRSSEKERSKSVFRLYLPVFFNKNNVYWFPHCLQWTNKNFMYYLSVSRFYFLQKLDFSLSVVQSVSSLHTHFKTSA